MPLADVFVDNRPEGAVLSVRGEIDLSNTSVPVHGELSDALASLQS
ncbi:MAG: hypothetical protein ABWZ15_13745 [Acidimicrobiia bacterium]